MPTTFFLKTNFGQGTLNAGITDVATSMVLNAGHTLPLVTGDLRVALYDAVTYPYPPDDPNMEIVTANWDTGNTYDITRAQEGTTGVAHSASDRVANMVTKGSIEELEAAINAREETANKNSASGYPGLDGSSKLTGSQQTYGVGVNTACEGNDGRLSDSRTPTAHAASHDGGSDDLNGALTPNAHAHAETDVTDGTLLARMAASEIVTGAWRFDNIVWIQKTSIEALLVGKDSDGGNVLVVDTTNSLITLGGVTPVIGCCLLLPSQNDPVTPTLSFGDGNTGFYEQSDNVLILALAGVGSITFDASWFFSTSNAAGWAIVDETPSSTNPVYTFRGDTDTGLTRAGTDTVGLVAGAISAIQYAEVSSSVLSTQQYDSGITAGTTQTQAGATQLDSSVNIVDSVPSANDGVKLPTAVRGVRVAVLNNGGANALLYPFLGDEIESLGVNASMALLEGKGVELIAVSTSRWSII